MKISYDPAAEAVYIYLTEDVRHSSKTEELQEGLMIDRSALGEIIGIEILYVSDLRLEVEK